MTYVELLAPHSTRMHKRSTLGLTEDMICHHRDLLPTRLQWNVHSRGRLQRNQNCSYSLPYHEIILYAYAADRTNRPTYVCLPSGLYNARTGRVLAQAGPEQEITPLPGIYFFDGWRVHPTLVIPTNLPSSKEAPVCDVEAPAHSTANTEQPRSPEEEARDILATAAKNQTEDGPSTRRAAIRACKYLRAMVTQHGPLIQSAHLAAKTHTQRSKSSATATTQYRPKEGELPVIAPELTSELLHCLSTLPDHGPWPRSLSIWKSLASGSPKYAGSFLQTNTPEVRWECPHQHRCQT